MQEIVIKLALNRSRNKKNHMKSNFIPVNEPLLNGNEKKYLNECIDTGWISSEGPFIKTFEQNLASYFGRKYGIAVANGTMAIDIAIDVLDLKEGDEVIMPSFTIISCVMGLVRNKCVPVFVDQELNTWNMNVSQIEAKINTKTRAIMVVHIYGLPVDMDPIIDLAKKYNLKIIEDAAEMHGQEYKNKKCGSFGDISTISFYPNKHITTGEGGMIFTDDEELAHKCQYYRNLCFIPEKRFYHTHLGYNARMTNLQAAVGLAQFEKIEEFIKKKRWIGKLYQELLINLPHIQLPLKSTAYAENIYWVFGLLIDREYHIDANEAMKKLADMGVGTRPFFFGMHKQPILIDKYQFNISLPICEHMSTNGFYIPSGLAITEEQIHNVANSLKKIFN